MKRIIFICLLVCTTPIFAQEEATEPTLGKTDTLNEWDLRAFPSPTSDLLIVKSSKEIKSIEFFDINGREIKPVEMPNNCYSLSSLPTGWVFLLVESTDGYIEKKNVYKH